MLDPKAIAEAYLGAWNEEDSQRRRVLLGQSWTSDARYVDPLMAGEGREGIATMIEAARGKFPGHAFMLRGTPDGYGRYVRLSWTLAAPAGDHVAHGSDVIRVDGQGRIADVIGFLDASAS
jgi:SnoaL-like domain